MTKVRTRRRIKKKRFTLFIIIVISFFSLLVIQVDRQFKYHNLLSQLSTLTDKEYRKFDFYISNNNLNYLTDELKKLNDNSATTTDTDTSKVDSDTTDTPKFPNEAAAPYFESHGIVIANKTYPLDPAKDPGGLTAECIAALQQMQEGAKADGIDLTLSSGYRSYQEQVDTYQYWVSVYGEEEANRQSSVPGHSEHQTGLAADIAAADGECTLDQCFADTPEGQWLALHAHEYGFIIRYPEGKEDITGYEYEPWHVRYLGVDIATEIYNQNTTLEEYLGIA